MSKMILRVGAALALVSMASAIATPTFAQLAPGARPQQGAARVAPGPNEPVIMVTRSQLTGGLRAPQQGDNDIGVISLSEFRAKYPEQGDAGFFAIQAENGGTCAETGEWIRESIAITAEAGELGEKWLVIRKDLAGLGEDLNKASRARTGGNVVSTILLCGLSLGLYCANAIIQNGAGEYQGQVNTKGAKINKRQSDLNARQSQLNLRATVLTMRMNIGFAKMTSWYCLRYHVDETIGATTYTVGATTYAPAPKPKEVQGYGD